MPTPLPCRALNSVCRVHLYQSITHYCLYSFPTPARGHAPLPLPLLPLVTLPPLLPTPLSLTLTLVGGGSLVGVWQLPRSFCVLARRRRLECCFVKVIVQDAEAGVELAQSF